MIVDLDFETRSEADLKKVGAWVYSEHSSTEIICARWQLDGEGRIEGWINPHIGPMPDKYDLAHLLELAADPDVLFCAHNAAFEYSIWHNVGVKRLGWPEIAPHRWRDTMAVACYYALPAALGNLCRVLGLPGKDPEGGRLISRYSKLNLKTAKRDIPREDLLKFYDYCGTDVEQEAAVGDILGDLPDAELEIFLHHFAINIRGIALDPGGIASAQVIVEQRAAELKAEFEELTGFSPGQVAVLKDWLKNEHGVDLPNVRADTIKELLDERRIGDEPVKHLPEDAERALEIRRSFARASTKKLDAMMRQRGKDGRAHFQTRYHGAGTGRDTGSGFQPLNLVRNWDWLDPEQLVRDIELGDPQFLDAQYGDAMDAIAKASRHWIVAEEGNIIRAGDFSSIEAVVAACIAKEEWKIELFRNKGDPYVTFASRATGREVLGKKHPDVTQQDLDDRQKIGKPGELAFGYQGSVGAWRRFDRTKTFDDAEVLGFVRDWRDLHPNIVSYWEGLQDAAMEAVTNSGRVTGYEDDELFERVDGWLTMILPDGKRLWYWAPEIRMLWPQWHRPLEDEECATGECGHNKRPQVTYMSQKEGHWRRVSSYGGKWFENRVQAIARQILKPAELRTEAAGYPQVLGVYDEIVTETPVNFGSKEELEEIMAEPAGRWCEDWPIRAEVWSGMRYKK